MNHAPMVVLLLAITSCDETVTRRPAEAGLTDLGPADRGTQPDTSFADGRRATERLGTGDAPLTGSGAWSMGSYASWHPEQYPVSEIEWLA